jgi:hypothetical protein
LLEDDDAEVVTTAIELALLYEARLDVRHAKDAQAEIAILFRRVRSALIPQERRKSRHPKTAASGQ